VTPFIRELVRTRAGDRCEYCHFPQRVVGPIFHVEHIIARQHGGADSDENLALSCDRCNAYKGPNLTAIDPTSQSVVPLFNPRIQRWEDHFRQRGFEIIGLTDVGRATARLLNFNHESRVDFRRRLGLIL
jgi:hypothetical protein